MQTPAARLTVRRTDPQDDGQRQVYVSLDGQRIAYLTYGKTVTVEMPAGHHTMKTNNTLNWKTIEFDAAPGEHVRFSMVNRPSRGFWGLLFLFGIGFSFLTVEKEESSA